VRAPLRGNTYSLIRPITAEFRGDRRGAACAAGDASVLGYKEGQWGLVQDSVGVRRWRMLPEGATMAVPGSGFRGGSAHRRATATAVRPRRWALIAATLIAVFAVITGSQIAPAPVEALERPTLSSTAGLSTLPAAAQPRPAAVNAAANTSFGPFSAPPCIGEIPQPRYFPTWMPDGSHDMYWVDLVRLEEFNAGRIVLLHPLDGENWESQPPVCGTRHVASAVSADNPQGAVSQWMYCTDLDKKVCSATMLDGHMAYEVEEDDDFIKVPTAHGYQQLTGNARLTAEQERVVGYILQNPLQVSGPITPDFGEGTQADDLTDGSRKNRQSLVWCVTDFVPSATGREEWCSTNVWVESTGLDDIDPTSNYAQWLARTSTGTPELTITPATQSVLLGSGPETREALLQTNVLNQPITLEMTGVWTVCAGQSNATLNGTNLVVTGPRDSSQDVRLCTTSSSAATATVTATVTPPAAEHLSWVSADEVCQVFATHESAQTVTLTASASVTFIAQPTLEVSKTSDPAAGTAVRPEDRVTYTVTVRNPSEDVEMTEGLITDDLSEVLDKATLDAAPQLTCTPAAGPCGTLAYTPGDDSFVWTSSTEAPIAPGAAAVITYSVIIEDGATGTLRNRLVEPAITVEHPLITWDKTVDVGADTMVDPGDEVTYTIEVTNTSDVAADTFTVTDDLSDVVTNASVDASSIATTYLPDASGSAGAASISADGQALTWTGTLGAGRTVQVSFTVTVHADAFGQLRNVFFDKSVVNPISASLAWAKVDASASSTPLFGAEWRLTPLSESGEEQTDRAVTVTDCATAPCAGADADPAEGSFRIDGLAPGDYHLVETKAPVGYVLDPTVRTVTVLGTQQLTTLADIVNERQDVPMLPLTGGLSTDSLTLTGGALLVITAALALLHLRRRHTLSLRTRA